MKNIGILPEILKVNNVCSFDNNTLTSEEVKLLLEAALRAPSISSKNTNQYIIIDDKELLSQISFIQECQSGTINSASIAIAVLGSPIENEKWLEDTSLSTGCILLQAAHISLQTCVVSVFGQYTSLGQDCSDYIRGILEIPYQIEVVNIILIGHSNEKVSQKSDMDLRWENIHINKYCIEK